TGVKGCDGRTWPVSTLAGHDRLAFVARYAVSALLLYGKSGTTTNDPSIVRVQSSSHHAHLDRCQNCQHVLVPDRCLVCCAVFREVTERSADLYCDWRGDRNYGAAIDSVAAQTAFQCCHSARHAGHHRFAGCVQRSGNGPGERAGTSSGRNEPV